MKKIKVNREAVKSAVAKMVSDKATVRAFLKGKTSKETLSKSGITLAKPL